MAKNSIRDYSATNSSNTDIQSIDISEGCSPAGINNAIREVMADLKDVSTGTIALESPKFDSILDGNIKATDASGTDAAGTATTIKGGAGTGTGAGGSIVFQVADGDASTGSSVNAHATAMTITDDGGITVAGDLTVDTTTLKVDSTNNRVGIGTTSPTKKVSASIGLNDTDGYVLEYSGEAKAGMLVVPATGEVRMGAINSTGTYFSTFYANNSEKMRILSGGDIAFGNTVANTVSGYNNQAGGGFVASDTHFEFATTANRAAVEIGKNNANDGQLVALRKQGATIGSIGTNENTDLYIAGGDTGLLFNDNADFISPATATGAGRDNAVDLGFSTVRWDDVYATNGTIQTSDANEKQQIAALTDAEITAAKAISQLFKTFKWNDSVAEKGDAARTHTGVIAQDVEAAMTAAGLDAGDYAFFISSTWWETQTEVPTVEADEENGIEAVAAYTRTDTYDTAEEAPEGATERTRMGIRYPELLSFIGAATEQRLTNVEARIAALEAS